VAIGLCSFAFFAAWCFIALVYSFIMVPETAGRALENIDALFEHPWYMIRKFAYAEDPVPEKDISHGSM